MPSTRPRIHHLIIAAVSIAALLFSTSTAFAATRHRHHRHHRASVAHTATVCANAQTPSTASTPAAMKTAVLCLVNQQRTSRGLQALSGNAKLGQSAQGWTNTMVATQNFWHGTNFAQRLSAVGFDWMYAGENIATGYGTPAQVVAGWMASPGHCRNILDPQYTSVGTGLVTQAISGFSTQPSTWTQDFGTPQLSFGGSNNWGPANRTC
jgi:uncharacterized protein YkwD